MEYFDSIIDAIGDTPLVRVKRVVPERPDGPLLLAKVEYLNPGGSVKDRIALRMIEQAEKKGLLQPGATIVEPTSGNTGVGLALVAQQRGYKTVFVCPDKVSEDKRAVLRAYGAEVVVCPTAVEPDDPRSYYSVSDRLAKEIPGAWKPDQYSNPDNPASHFDSTGPEIWRQTDGLITHFVAGVGTGGTISGTGNYLKQVSGGKVKVIGADPEGSVYSGGTGRPYLVEGVGEDFWPEAYDKKVADEIIAVPDSAAFEMTRRLAREEGLLVGGSCGMAMVAAAEVVKQAKKGDVIVVLLPDSGRGYLSKVFNDLWLASYGFLSTSGNSPTVGDALHAKHSDLPEFVHVHPTDDVKTAIKILREYGVSQMPVVRAEPPFMAAEVVGSIDEAHLLQAVASNESVLGEPIESHMSKPMPAIGAGEPIAAATTALESTPAVIVHLEGKPVGVLTRQDVLTYLMGAHGLN